MEAGFRADARDGHIGAQQVACQDQPFVLDVLMQAVAGGFLEFAHEMVAAQEDLCSQTFNLDIFFQMTADIAEYLLDLGVVRDAFLCLQFMVF